MSGHPPTPGYELLQLLGFGGHLIYKARQTSTVKIVHLKVVHSCGKFGIHVADSLRRKAEVIACLDDPKIVKIIELSGEQG